MVIHHGAPSNAFNLSLSFTRFLTSSHVKLIPNATSQAAHGQLQLQVAQVAQVPDRGVMCSSLAGPRLFCSANVIDVPCDKFRGEKHVAKNLPTAPSFLASNSESIPT